MPEVSKTVGQALRVLIALGQGPASIATLARQLGLHRTVLQRLLVTLQADGFVHRLDDGAYALGMTLVELAARVDNPVRRAAQRPMLALFEQVGETVALTVREGDDAVSADQLVVPDRLVRAEYPTGFRHSLAVAAAGRAILAFADPATVQRLCRQVADEAALLAQLAEIRRLGYACTSDELGHGASGLAAPILDASGRAVASVGIVAPSDRFPAAPAVAGPIMVAAAQASAALAGAAVSSVAAPAPGAAGAGRPAGTVPRR
ncbi:MAG TPA: IclR family transcriptional regulator [Jatrophihabitans sp.]|nr:IclR family transcriptional regulator [Jatrophihabitans sp.]